MKKLFASMMMLVSMLTGLSAAQYIENKPLGEVVTVAVGPVKPGPIQLPVITWGGDIATLLANGGAVNTFNGSAFSAQKLNIRLVRKDAFAEQVTDFKSGVSQYLRGTVGMVNQALSALTDPNVRPVVIYQMTWSTGGDVLVVRGSINSAADLKGKTIVVQAYGPHIDFLAQTLKDAGLSVNDVKIKYVKDITGTDNSPAEALRADPSVDAAFVISPDAVELTGGPGKTGTGAEKTVKGAKYLMSTLTASRVIPDVYAVRADYLRDHLAEVESFVHALMLGQEQLDALAKNSAKKAEYDRLMTSAALVFLDTKDAVDSAKGLLADCTFVGYQGNVKFFTDPAFPRRFEVVSAENQAAIISLGLLPSKSALTTAGFDYDKIKAGLRNTVVEAESPRFDPAAVAQLVAKRGDDLGSVFAFDIQFEPNMASFDASKYAEQFQRVLDMAATYSGAILTVEGNTDPNDYLKVRRNPNATEIDIKQKKQANINTSLARANRVRDELITYIKAKGVTFDESQVTTIGYGCMRPKQGVEKAGPYKGEPLPSTTEAQWRTNMRVTFSIRNVEAEANVFAPVTN